MAQANFFTKFTKRYELSKTLRFELKPVGNTQKMLERNKVFEKDKTIDNSYNQAKFYFDTLHQQFIDSALASDKVKKLPFEDFANFLEEQNKKLSKKRKEKNEASRSKSKDKTESLQLQKEINELEKKVENEKEKFYKRICPLFDSEAENWKKKYEGLSLSGDERIEFSKSDIKQKGVRFLTAAGILKVLKYEFPESNEPEFKKLDWPSLYVNDEVNPGKNRYIFDSFDKFAEYLSKFQQTRDNLYTDGGLASAVATRIVSNLDIFLANKKVFEDKYHTLFREIGFNQTYIFEIDNYHKYLLQKDIEALVEKENDNRSYNKVIGEINQQIKEFRDQKASKSKQNKDKSFIKSDYPLFKTLEKQILGKVDKEKQLIEKTEIETEEEIFVKIFQKFIDFNEKHFEEAQEFMEKFFIGEYAEDYEGIYLKNSTINTMSHRWFADSSAFELKLPQTTKNKDESDEPKVKKFVSLADIKNAVENLEGQFFKKSYYDKDVVKPEQAAWEQFLAVWREEFENLFKDIQKEEGETRKGYSSCLKEANKLQTFSRGEKELISVVKNYADTSLNIFQMMKYLALDERDLGKMTGLPDTNFYAELDEYVKDFEFIKYYNAFRNFITKKSFDEDKIKLNFEKNPPILKGFSKQYSSYLLKKVNDGKDEFYLGIIKSGIIDESIVIKDQSKYSYFPATQLKFQNLINKVFEPQFGYKYSEQKNELKAISDAQEFIKTRHLSRHPELKILVEKKFSSKIEFTKEVNRVCIEIYSKNSFHQLDKSQVEVKNEKGELYLFKIKNKDMEKYTKRESQKNIHTLYFGQLFDERNIRNPILKISGGSEMFLRDETEKIKKDQNHIITKDNKDITKFLKNEFGVEKYVYNRYAERKYFLHLSIVLNYGKPQPPQNRDKLTRFAGAYNKNIRQEVAKFTRQEIRIIGIDRGEKNLLYYSVVNQKGDILDQGSLNEIETVIKEKRVNVNYHDKLVVREKERLENRRSWQQVARIKDLKKGYISHVIHKICQLIIDHKAIVILEDLNMRFKQIRGGIERSVYQQFEKALIDKLGYLAFKDQKDLHAPGGILNGYQLVAPFISFEKLGKQTGILFYTQADYTSVTDPLTGFRKNIYISNSASLEKIKDMIQLFEVIGWDKIEQSYFFTYNPVDFTEEKNKENFFSKKWTIYAKVPRITSEKDKNGYWICKAINLNQQFEELFKLWNFDRPRGDIKKQIQSKESKSQLKGVKQFDGEERDFYHAFIYFFNLILQLRNSYSKQFKTKEENGKVIVEEVGEDIDFIASPVKPFFSTSAVNKNGDELSPANFAEFEKKISPEADKKKILREYNGDANGAYNIARKGLMILRRIAEEPEHPALYISKYDWDKFLDQNR